MTYRRMRGIWHRYAGQLDFDSVDVYIKKEDAHEAQVRSLGQMIGFGFSTEDAKEILAACGLLQALPHTEACRALTGAEQQ